MSARVSRRQVLAHIALADAPTPAEIAFTFGGKPAIAFSVDDVAALVRWADVFGVRSARERTHAWVRDGNLHSLITVRGSWRGWPVRVEAASRVPVDQLDDATRKQLRTVAHEGGSNRGGTR